MGAYFNYIFVYISKNTCHLSKEAKRVFGLWMFVSVFKIKSNIRKKK